MFQVFVEMNVTLYTCFEHPNVFVYPFNQANSGAPFVCCIVMSGGCRLVLWLFVDSKFGTRWIHENGKCPGAWGDICSWRQYAATFGFNLFESV